MFLFDWVCWAGSREAPPSHVPCLGVLSVCLSAEKMVDHGIHSLAIKDMAGLLKPKAATMLVRAPRRPCICAWPAWHGPCKPAPVASLAAQCCTWFVARAGARCCGAACAAPQLVGCAQCPNCPPCLPAWLPRWARCASASPTCPSTCTPTTPRVRAAFGDGLRRCWGRPLGVEEERLVRRKGD